MMTRFPLTFTVSGAPMLGFLKKFKKKKADAPEGEEGEEKKEAAPEEKEEKKEGEEGAEGEGEAGGKKSKKKLFIIIGAAVLVLALGGAGAYFMLGGKDTKKEHAEGEEATAEDGEEATSEEGSEEAATEHGGEEAAAEGEHGGEGEEGKKVAKGPVYFEMPQILVNLNTGTPGGGKAQASFIKTSVTLVLAGPKDVEMAKLHLPRLMDNYNTFLRELRPNDLYGSSGVYRLREEMLVRANKLLAPARVNDVLFREIIIQ